VSADLELARRFLSVLATVANTAEPTTGLRRDELAPYFDCSWDSVRYVP
jgi:hypothetical protein